MNNITTSILFVSLLHVTLVSHSYSQATIKHPQEKYIPYLEGIGEKNISLISKNNSDKSIFTEKAHNAKKIYQIGQKQSSKYKTLGRITGVVTDQEKNLYLLDSGNNTVLVYDSLGKFRYQFGRGGHGPGEFQSPIDMAMDKRENIYIADRFNLIHKFVKTNNRYTYQRDLKIDVIPDAFCVMNEKIYVRGLKPGRIKKQPYNTIHAYQLSDGNPLFSFGKSYQAENLLVKKQLSDGKITCDSFTSTVVSTFDMMPYLFGYTEKGNIKWISKIDPFKTRPIVAVYNSFCKSG